MEGSCLSDLFETVYGVNAVTHMMSGKVVSRAIRGDGLVESAVLPRKSDHGDDDDTVMEQQSANDFTIKPTTAGILLNKLSDHQPCFVLIDTTFARSHNPKFIRKYVQIEDVITNINNDICSSEIYNKIDKRLTADPNVNYSIMHDIIEETKNTHMKVNL